VATKEQLTSSHRKDHLTAESVTPERGHALASPNGGVPPRASEDTPLSIEERYDEVRQLIALGKNNGYLGFSADCDRDLAKRCSTYPH
jgi:hypothetical protein